MKYKHYGTGFRPQCVKCGHYLLPCTATATGLHPEVRDATTGKLISRLEES